jgi:hypothetical protein
MRVGSGIRREAIPTPTPPDYLNPARAVQISTGHSDEVRGEASKHLFEPVMGKFSRNIRRGRFRRSDVGIAAGQIALLEFGKSAAV